MTAGAFFVTFRSRGAQTIARHQRRTLDPKQVGNTKNTPSQPSQNTTTRSSSSQAQTAGDIVEVNAPRSPMDSWDFFVMDALFSQRM
eukprot:Nitzschia sp. Nitz4//scaffold68_size99682//36107//36367//NITZ4_004561-RA/size99682-processed-gene-0.19-mRNA-1//1//CDS//3329556584//7404//frame0